MNSTTPPAKVHGSSKPADVPCEELCCPEFPNFYCGQLLTDHDLTALVDWVRARFRLRRLAQGWGAVCGLDVAAAVSSPSRPQLVVNPGYAIDCKGNDVVLCPGGKAIDVSGFCRADARRLEKAKSPAVLAPHWDKLAAGDVLEVQPVDVYVQASEEKRAAEVVPRRRRCEGQTECEYTRIRETAEVRVESATDDGPSCREKEFDRCWDELAGEFFKVQAEAKAGTKTWKEVCRWLLRLLDQPDNRLRQFCWALDALRKLPPEALGDDAQVIPILFWIVQDRRNRLRTLPCGACTGCDRGVRIARVWLRRDEAGCCTILAIDNDAPYRRAFGPDRPAPIGQFNLCETLWKEDKEAETFLQKWNVSVEVKAEPTPTTKETWKAIHLRDTGKFPKLCLGAGAKVVLFTVEGRVVGFSGEPPAAPQQPGS